MKALVFLCGKSIELREKRLSKEKEDECEVEHCEKGIYEDEDEVYSDEDDDDDEDYDCNDDLEGLFHSKFESLDEVIHFRDVFCGMEQQNPQMYNYYLSCLDPNDLQLF